MNNRDSLGSSVAEPLSLTDQEWGFRYGCDGVMNSKEARGFMSRSRWTLDELVLQKRIRARKDIHSGRLFYCRRSLMQYFDEHMTEL